MRVIHRSIDGGKKPIIGFMFSIICFENTDSGLLLPIVGFKFLLTCFNLSNTGIKPPITGLKKANACHDLSIVGFENSNACFDASIAGSSQTNTTHAQIVKAIFPTRIVMKGANDDVDRIFSEDQIELRYDAKSLYQS